MKNNIKNLIIAFVLLAFIVLNSNLQIRASDYQIELSEEEYASIEALVYDKLNTNNFTYEIISGFEAYNRYVLIEGTNSYLIYDRVMEDYVEYSTYSNSVYYNLDSNIEKIYLGTTYYFYKDGNSYYDIMNGKILTNQEFNNYVQFENNKLLSLTEQDINITNEINNTQSRSTSTTTEIEASYYYINLNENFVENVNGSCSYVAATMLLSYYDSIVNDNVISETYDVKVTENFQNFGLVNSQSYTSSPGVTESFQNSLILLGRELGYTTPNGYSISISETVSLMEVYLRDQGILYNTYYSGHLSSQSAYVSFCRTAIDNDCPVIIQISGYDPSIVEDEINHAVVGYGYDSTGIIVHFGLENYPYYVNINNYTISHAMYVEITDSHVCSDNYQWQANGCTGTVCSCGVKTCNHESLNYVSTSSSVHVVSCNACDYSYTEEHDIYVENHTQYCSKCDYEYVISIGHNYVYIPIAGGVSHRKQCLCGVSSVEACISLGQVGSTIKTCALCGQTMSGNIGFIPLRKEEDVEIE